MASTISKLLCREIRLLKPIVQAMDIEGARKGQDAIGRLGARVLQGSVDYVPEPFADFEADWAVPTGERKPGAIVYLHGGSYTAGSLDYARGFGGILAERTGRPVLCVGYRLAPENPFPAALDDAAAAYRRATEAYPASPIAIVGESAGGGLTFALAVHLKSLDLPRPACLVALSPWADLTCTSDAFARCEKDDPCLSREALMQSAGYYAGTDLQNPLVSPLFADLTGLAPALVYAGTEEMLMDDSVHLAAAIEEAGGSCELHVVDEMWHVFVLYGTPEAKDALARIDAFVDGHLAGMR